MATVGYGDYYPKSLPGRIVIVLAAIVGVVLVSILVVALNVNLNSTLRGKREALTLHYSRMTDYGLWDYFVCFFFFFA